MTEWYRFTPQDTLYFRGAEPANMGENHTASIIFPPPAHTIAGALRTAVLVQNDIAFTDYNNGNCPSEVIDAIGNSGEDSPFDILGPFFSCDDNLWIPCPYIWLSTKNGKTQAESRLRKIVVSAPIKKTSLVNTASGKQLFWAQGNDLESLGGDWVHIDEICTATTEKRIKSSGDLFVSEIHTGIALDVKDKRRTAREGHLYSFVHARLCAGVMLVFGVTRKLPLKDYGALKLGAEQRFGEYKKIGGITLPQGSSGLYMALSILAGNEAANRQCVATGRIRYYGGWDLHKGFHKPMKGFFPAGSVFDKKINDNCIEL